MVTSRVGGKYNIVSGIQSIRTEKGFKKRTQVRKRSRVDAELGTTTGKAVQRL